MAMGHCPPRRKPPATWLYLGKKLPLAEIARRTGINVRTLQYRLANGMSPQKAFARLPSKRNTPQPASRVYDFRKPTGVDHDTEKGKSAFRDFSDAQTGFTDRAAGDYFEALCKSQK